MKRISYEKTPAKEQLIIPKNYPNQNIKQKPSRHRIHCISVRLNNKELKFIDIKRGSMNKSVWLRRLALNQLIPLVPEINIEAWKALSEISQKLNRIAIHVDTKSKESKLTHTELFAVKRELRELRQKLINADIWSNPDEGNAEDQTW